MKTAKPPAPDGGASGSSRRQPVRQTRVNPPRTSSLNRANPLAAAAAPEQPINILPGVTHFADAITALPKELVRHFTLLKEVDAKIFAPEAALLDLLHETLNTPVPDLARPPPNDAPSSAVSASASAPTSARNSTAGPPTNPRGPPSDSSAASVFDPTNIPRRTLFRDTALKIQELLGSLEEKNHVIATANDALNKELSRIDDIWPHLEAEFSEEAKWGSATHWAYIENRQAKANDKQAERTRREAAATLSAAAQALAEEAATRSSDRKQAMAAKKNSKNQAVAAAAADADNDKVQETGKKTQGAKSRKPLPDSGPVGLGIAPGAAAGSAPAPKRRKAEAAKPNGGAPVERAMGTVFGNAAASKQRTTSPRETPAPESGAKKRKALPTSSNQAKKSRTAASVTSSPVIGSFPDPVRPGRGSPAPSAAAPRPASSRARQNSTVSNAENPGKRPASVAPNKTNGNSQGTPDAGQPSAAAKASTDAKAQKEATAVSVPTKPSALKPETEEQTPVPEPAQNGTKKEAAPKAAEEPAPPKKEAAALAIQPTPAAAVKITKSGRASKPSTPAIATFAEAATASAASTTTSRSRPSRNADSGGSTATASTATSTATATVTATTTTTAKRSHKKGASISASAAAAAQAQAAAAAAAPSASAAAKDKDKDKDSATATATATTAGTKKEKASATSSISSDTRKAPSTTTATTTTSTTTTSKSKTTTKNGTTTTDNHTTTKNNEVEDEEEEEDDEQEVQDEDVYCFCNQGSYGEMVACDAEGCQREWFHLECVGLRVAPEGNAKWYCEDCKKRLKIASGRR
ncbi:hypothetical protein C8A05DRAFT_35997 [Staphylotrichum tortipilum]|uniref:Chromatin modification-related protein n=1 Tax=Staphylotrichum tortipilum TaxID=2831512 RepID=A0AAN6MGX9_9PEZI|nr:hypothetical protein C8A05DRAFT_35997 [Staphylotrichum longicolle]